MQVLKFSDPSHVSKILNGTKKQTTRTHRDINDGEIISLIHNNIQDWVAKEKEFYNQFKSGVVILRSTPKAFQISLEKSGEVHWIPKSQCKIIERKEASFNKFF